MEAKAQLRKDLIHSISEELAKFVSRCSHDNGAIPELMNAVQWDQVSSIGQNSGLFST